MEQETADGQEGGAVQGRAQGVSHHLGCGDVPQPMAVSANDFRQLGLSLTDEDAHQLRAIGCDEQGPERRKRPSIPPSLFIIENSIALLSSHQVRESFSTSV
jgi:hypothetical protein